MRFEGHFIGFQKKTPIREFREFQKVSGWFQVVSRDRRTVSMSLGGISNGWALQEVFRGVLGMLKIQDYVISVSVW